jgi:glutamine synthetase
MKKKEIVELITTGEHDKVKVAIADLDGILRGKYMQRDKFISALDAGFGFCDVVFGWDSSDKEYALGKVTGGHTGFPDGMATIDAESMREIPWEQDLPFFLADFSADKKRSAVCPRSLLKRIISEAVKSGYQPYFAQEFEWFNFEETPHSIREKGYRDLKSLTPGMFGYSLLRTSMENEFMHDLFESMNFFGIPLEGLHTETGPGVYEAAIEYSGALEAADRAVLFKAGTKEIAYQHGILATFMAKWNIALPGCSGHVHQSLWDDKENLFFDGKDKQKMSPIMRSYIAGQLHCLPHILPMLAPTVNSYKRLSGGAWAPSTVSWGIDNRTVALRCLPVSAKACRLETRVPASDTNPYLAIAACLASGLYGIKKKLKLDQPETKGSAYAAKNLRHLPNNLQKATGLMRDSDVAKELFGETFVDHFCMTREHEWSQFSTQVTDWELQRYLEII